MSGTDRRPRFVTAGLWQRMLEARVTPLRDWDVGLSPPLARNVVRLTCQDIDERADPALALLVQCRAVLDEVVGAATAQLPPPAMVRLVHRKLELDVYAQPVVPGRIEIATRLAAIEITALRFVQVVCDGPIPLTRVVSVCGVVALDGERYLDIPAPLIESLIASGRTPGRMGLERVARCRMQFRVRGWPA